MSSALKPFEPSETRRSRFTRLMEVVDLLRAIRSEANVLAHDETLRKLLQEEQTWLLRTTD